MKLHVTISLTQSFIDTVDQEKYTRYNSKLDTFKVRIMLDLLDKSMEDIWKGEYEAHERYLKVWIRN